ncbi:uncharacterized protein LOC119654021, partial [Hermetia illucens]|uniref:uncharacterized protein LOC119654021 n=1 Tax=Hermetia illucens TaxID=343691 RepID=UPI0018CC3921
AEASFGLAPKQTQNYSPGLVPLQHSGGSYNYEQNGLTKPIIGADVKNIKQKHFTEQEGENAVASNVTSVEVPSLPINWWAGEDHYNFEAFDLINGVWPIGHPLSLPDWADHKPKPYVFENIWQYEDLNGLIEAKIHRLLEENKYDTVNVFLDFYKAFKKTRRLDLKSFFQFYDIPINRRHHMCVSFAMEIITRLVDAFPELAQHLYIVSCEEAVESVKRYIDYLNEVGMKSEEAGTELEHALVAMNFDINGRAGTMIIDPGYHVARAVTVMKDQHYPHTGWFTQCDEKHVKREYCYSFSPESQSYIEWSERETRGDKVKFQQSLIYVEHPYRTAVDVTVRRNLVYDFRSLLSTDAKGRVYAGIYFPITANVNDAQFTIFYDGPNDTSVKVKLLFSVFKNAIKIPDTVKSHVEQAAPQMKLEYEELLGLIKSLAEVVSDQGFISQVLAINEQIGEMSA